MTKTCTGNLLDRFLVPDFGTSLGVQKFAISVYSQQGLDIY